VSRTSEGVVASASPILAHDWCRFEYFNTLTTQSTFHVLDIVATFMDLLSFLFSSWSHHRGVRVASSRRSTLGWVILAEVATARVITGLLTDR
jgi:hypothetical protein